MQPDEVFTLKDLNSSYVRQVGILLQSKVHGDFSFFMSCETCSTWSWFLLPILIVSIGTCHKKEDHTGNAWLVSSPLNRLQASFGPSAAKKSPVCVSYVSG